jgi:F-box-like
MKINQGSETLILSGVEVPKDVLQLIFKLLPPEELLTVNKVCRAWYHISSRDSLWGSFDLREVFPNATFIDKEAWKTYVDVDKHKLELEEKERPYVIKQDYIEIKRMESRVEEGQGITILTLPKGLTFNKVKAFAASHKIGNKTDFENIWARITEELGNKEIEETTTVAITNGIFKGSRNKSVEEQKKLVEGLNCEMPGLVSVAALAIMRFIISDADQPIRLFGDFPLTYTRCEEKLDKLQVAFGGFALGGPVAYLHNFDHDSRGVGGLRKFKAIGT